MQNEENIYIQTTFVKFSIYRVYALAVPTNVSACMGPKSSSITKEQDLGNCILG